jgi:hypothetical protein
MPSVPTGRDDPADTLKRSNGFAGDTSQSIGSTRDISAAVEKEQRSNSARNGKTRQ